MSGMEDVLESAAAGWKFPLSSSDTAVLVQALTAAGYGSMHDAWFVGHQSGWDERNEDALANWTPGGYTQYGVNPYPPTEGAS